MPNLKLTECPTLLPGSQRTVPEKCNRPLLHIPQFLSPSRNEPCIAWTGIGLSLSAVTTHSTPSPLRVSWWCGGSGSILFHSLTGTPTLAIFDHLTNDRPSSLSRGRRIAFALYVITKWLAENTHMHVHMRIVLK